MSTQPTNPKATAALMIEIAKRVADEQAHRCRATANGSPKSEVIDWIHPCTVSESEGVVYVGAPQNRVVSIEASRELLRKTCAAITLAWDAAGLLPNGKVRCVKRDGSMVWRTGYHHMGVFCTTGRMRGYRVPGTY
jgi:hypothetical protein